MTILFEHKVDISDGKGIVKSSDGFSVAEVEVEAESDKQLVVKGSKYQGFIVIEKVAKGREFSTCLNKESIGLCANDSVWGSRITYTLYSTSRKRAKTIRKEIELEIAKRFGFFTGNLNLDCIKD